ncbi:MAG: type II toxin-antitoxin system RelE/ParE family toxin [Terrimicrobiaceae bacterium]|jgi:proteic killer suppression protein
MIQNFSDADTRELFENESNRRFAFIARVALRKLIQMNRASLEALKGNLSGFYSIRINDQWRIVFCWTPQGPAQVRIGDYH